MKINDFKSIDSAVRTSKILEYRRQMGFFIWGGKFREARICQKELAKIAVEDFDSYKQMPIVNYQFQGIPLKSFFEMAFNVFRFKIYSKFVRKTPEEKQLRKLSKEYFSALSKEDIKKQTVNIVYRPFDSIF